MIYAFQKGEHSSCKIFHNTVKIFSPAFEKEMENSRKMICAAYWILLLKSDSRTVTRIQFTIQLIFNCILNQIELFYFYALLSRSICIGKSFNDFTKGSRKSRESRANLIWIEMGYSLEVGKCNLSAWKNLTNSQ